MKTLIIIDDEMFFRKSVCQFISKQKHYEIIGEANNGKNGIEMIRERKPDIAVVDISMPVMNGMEMIQSLYQDCATKFILLTGYADFEYAKQAISFGVKEYLLKPLDNQELLTCLDRISKEIDSEKSRDSMIQDYFQTRNAYQRQMIQLFFHKAIAGGCQPEELSVLKKQIGLEQNGDYLVLLLKINQLNPNFWDAEADLSLLHSIVENICMELFGANYPKPMYVDYSKLRQVLILQTAPAHFHLSELEMQCHHLLEVLQETAQISASVYSGTPCHDVEGIRISYEEALSALHNHALSFSEGFYYFQQVSSDGEVFLKSEVYQQILILLRQKKEAELLEYFSDYFSRLQHQNLHIRQIWTAASSLLTLLDSFLLECGQNQGDFPTLQSAFDTYQNCESIENLKQLIVQNYLSVLARLRKNSGSGKSSLITKVQTYLSEHLGQPDLRLETVALHFYVSPQYLSTIFSQETNMTLTAYLNTCRMQKAKELLLQEAPSIQNTASLCGFTDSGYFSKCFRKHYGISPKNFLLLTRGKDS